MAGAAEADGAGAQALALKEQGNAAFKKAEFEAAVEAYSRALELDKTQHLCFSNRSAAYLKLGCKDGVAEASKTDLLEKALSDANQCVELNPSWAKGYSRQASVLQELKRWDEALAACQKGLDLSSDSALEKMRSEVVNRRFASQLLGAWHGTVDLVLGGYEQQMEFMSETEVRVQVLGRALIGKYWVDAGQVPHHLNIQVPMTEAPPGMPPAPPVPYIAKIDDEGLHICCPFMSMERPAKFEGPGYCLMRSGPLSQLEEGAEAAHLTPEQAMIECAKDLAQALPDSKLEDPSQFDSEEATRDKLMMQVKFETSMYGVQRKFGEAVMKKVLEATKSGSAPAGLAGTPELKLLTDKLNACGLFEAIEKAPEPSPAASSSKRKAEEEPKKEQPGAGQAQSEQRPTGRSPPEAPASGASAASLQVICAVTLGAAIAAGVAFWWRRRQLR